MDVRDAALKPADVLCVDTGAFWGKWVRLGGLLEGDGGRCDHVVVVHHTDAAGNLWGIEGKPGGVGWVELGTCAYRLVSSNVKQPRTDAERQAVCDVVKGLVQLPYDWAAIVVDAMRAIDDQKLWASEAWGRKPPGHIVCSSLADWAYEHAGLPSPVDDRWVTPGGWDTFNRTEGWRL